MNQILTLCQLIAALFGKGYWIELSPQEPKIKVSHGGPVREAAYLKASPGTITVELIGAPQHHMSTDQTREPLEIESLRQLLVKTGHQIENTTFRILVHQERTDKPVGEICVALSQEAVNQTAEVDQGDSTLYSLLNGWGVPVRWKPGPVQAGSRAWLWD